MPCLSSAADCNSGNQAKVLFVFNKLKCCYACMLRLQISISNFNTMYVVQSNTDIMQPTDLKKEAKISLCDDSITTETT